MKKRKSGGSPGGGGGGGVRVEVKEELKLLRKCKKVGGYGRRDPVGGQGGCVR